MPIPEELYKVMEFEHIDVPWLIPLLLGKKAVKERIVDILFCGRISYKRMRKNAVLFLRFEGEDDGVTLFRELGSVILNHLDEIANVFGKTEQWRESKRHSILKALEKEPPSNFSLSHGHAFISLTVVPTKKSFTSTEIELYLFSLPEELFQRMVREVLPIAEKWCRVRQLSVISKAREIVSDALELAGVPEGEMMRGYAFTYRLLWWLLWLLYYFTDKENIDPVLLVKVAEVIAKWETQRKTRIQS
ncbi:MAG: hypothetical protein ACP5IE_00280 [Infirmifilum sp.]